ncbi:trimeric intracellular cation channel family protein [Bifidobacterium jacchi]|uniref:Trimeric intracellular cation channel family protein n=1 Tax=Bifidobacterium jacchi TaxID=2490545 RepID=A0A5N5RGJ1_9BIFI|nr:TRIC cation channel family protein [Bifidobacterium jacchi]KAB5606404.1 trimeric intracellular cation channel family protein [Bifidobacterium jacchi]
MEVALESNDFFLGIEYLAIFCSGLMGGLCAVKKNYDVFAMLITAWLTALGGGIIRDVMLGSLPPVGIADRGFVLTALISGLAIAVIHPEVDKLKWSMLTIDALSVAMFAVNGTSKAIMYHTSGMTAVFMGMFTALGGGLVRDMLLNDVPMVIRDKHWYAVPSAVGCVLTVLVCRGVQHGILDFTWEVTLDVAIVILVVAMRLLSVKFNIMLPGAMTRHNTYLPSQSRYLRRPVIHPGVRGRADDGDEGDGNAN